MAACVARDLRADQLDRARSLGEQLGLGGVLHRDIAGDSALDAAADRQQAVVLQDRGALVPERKGDALAFGRIEDDARIDLEQDVLLVEEAGVLGDRVEQAAERRPRLAVQRVRVRCRDDVGPGLVDLGVDRESGLVDRAVAGQDTRKRGGQVTLPAPSCVTKWFRRRRCGCGGARRHRPSRSHRSSAPTTPAPALR